MVHGVMQMKTGQRLINLPFILIPVNLDPWIESYARRRLTPFLFPQGRLTGVKGAARYSNSRRI